MTANVQKRDGVHYTPAKLAQFLADQTVVQFRSVASSRRLIRVLDPACGDGELLLALVESLTPHPDNIQVFGFEKDPVAARRATERLHERGIAQVKISVGDFLQYDPRKYDPRKYDRSKFDIVITNPPYVRTQVLGSKQAQDLAKQFGIGGRVDLYQAFTIAVSELLGENGVLGLLTSNRFMSTKSGASLRKRLHDEFEIKQLFDLGDTKLFTAAVLPVVMTAIKRPVSEQNRTSPAAYCRVYQSSAPALTQIDSSILDVVAKANQHGVIQTSDGNFLVERGELSVIGNDSIWSLSNQASRDWLSQVQHHAVKTFGEIADIKVGIKTTADKVFVRGGMKAQDGVKARKRADQRWSSLPENQQPEPTLLCPLLTHHDACRWRISQPPSRTVLYPYEQEPNSPDRKSTRVAIDLADYPKAAAYLNSHRQRLESRTYVVKSGRKWFEIWVAHRPHDWLLPKIVWPDISEHPKFFLDNSGAIVNGDCYWIKLKPDVHPDWVFLMLAIANSKIATKYYDTVFHNKLYAGRRRFMTQYVKEFPLPDIHSALGKKIIRLAKKLVETPTSIDEEKMESLVQQSFGF